MVLLYGYSPKTSHFDKITRLNNFVTSYVLKTSLVLEKETTIFLKFFKMTQRRKVAAEVWS